MSNNVSLAVLLGSDGKQAAPILYDVRKAWLYMIDFFKSNRFKIIIGIIAILFGMMLYSASSEGVSNIPKNLLSMITSPFQKVTAYISDATGSFLDTFLNASNTASENELLREQVNELNQRLVDYEKLVDENAQLKEIAGIKESYPDFEIANAFITGRDPADRYGSFTIDKGTLHGVALNDPVITSSGLIGYISDISTINARVKTILSPELDVSAYEISSKELGVVAGDVKLGREGLCKMSILSEETVIKQNDMIVTAGSSGKFPKGVPIGKVREVLSETHGITMYATIEPMEKIDEIITVQVITDYPGQGSELLDYVK